MSSGLSWDYGAPYSAVLLRLIEVLAGWQVGVFFQMLRSQRFADGMLLGKPFAEINELAALRTERPELSVEPRACLAACRTFDLRRPAHVQLRLTPHFSADCFQVSGDADCRGAWD